MRLQKYMAMCGVAARRKCEEIIASGKADIIYMARALLADCPVLVLDEATSALDNDTEKAIMNSINMLHGKKTLIIIAHRLQTIEKCNMVYRVENGKAILEKGSM